MALLWTVRLLMQTLDALLFFLNDPAPPEISPLPLPGALPIPRSRLVEGQVTEGDHATHRRDGGGAAERAAPRIVAQRYRHAPRERRHQVARRIERAQLDRDRNSTRLNSSH